MPIVHRFPAPERHPRTTWSNNAELGCALHQGLSTPVAALRASVEGLVTEVRGTGPVPAAVPGVLDEVELLGRNVQNLIDFAAPVEPQPIPCSVEELVLAAARPLPPPNLKRLVIAHAEAGARAVVDGPLVVRLLWQLLENALEAGEGEVLLAAHTQENGLELGVLNRASRPLDPRWALQPFHSSKPNRLGLGLSIADRHARELGGTLLLDARASGTVRASLTLPEQASPVGEELAA